MTAFTVEEIELSFIREFATGGDIISATSREHRREKMRIAILKASKEGRAFYDSGMTYAEAYRRCYGMAVELRRVPRTAGRALPDAITEPPDDEDDDE